MLYYGRGSANEQISEGELRTALHGVLKQLGIRKRVLAIPPDFTRFHSQAGILTSHAYEFYGDAMSDVLPALGTHIPMSSSQIEEMFPGVPSNLFRIHDWRHGVRQLGVVPAAYIREISEGAVSWDWPAQAAVLMADGGHDLILSIGQVVPHEVIGFANFNKNIFVGTGGAEAIHKSHFLGAAYGMERIMGHADNPVRQMLNYASVHYLQDYPIVYVQTVIGSDEDGKLYTRGLFIGDDIECFNKACELSLKVNFKTLEQPLKKVVVHLDPAEFKSTWLGNKAIYRTRMAIADGGELTVLAPGVEIFGEDPMIDKLIRRYGYVGTPAVLDAVANDPELQENLGAAAHLIHGSSEGRFSITYAPGHLSRQEIESVNYRYADPDDMREYYNPEVLRDGYNTLADGTEIFYISNPALGLWDAR